jgi:pyruvate/2-oxoglutarate dehydrogenase complex dihydrolipoamide dehydrogenase (E3) component
MADYEYDLGVIGGGAAGLTVSAGASQLGAKVILIEKEKNLGGDCLHFGCVPSKTLIRSANIYHLMKSGPKYGLPQIEPPPASFSRIAAHIAEVQQKIQKHDSEERFCRLGVQVETGDPAFSDPHTVNIKNKSFKARHWVIATGSSPAIPKITGLESTSYITNKDLFTLDSLPTSLIILGAGPIAIEMAQAFARLGSRVSVIQRSGQILSKEDKDMADLIMKQLISEGIEFYLNTTVSQTNTKKGLAELIIKAEKGKQLSLKAEKLLIALGRKPNLEGLDLEKAQVDYTPKGITVDNRLRTTCKHIFAAGDVTGQYQFTHAAGYEGGVVLANSIFRLPKKVDYTWLPWCTFTDPELASIGLNEKRAGQQGIDYKVWQEEFDKNDRALAEGAGQGLLKMVVDKNETPLGVQILGPRAGDLLCEWVALLNAKVKLSTLASSVHPYPTFGEINKKVAGDLMAEKLFSEKIKKGLKLIFNTKGRACSQEQP